MTVPHSVRGGQATLDICRKKDHRLLKLLNIDSEEEQDQWCSPGLGSKQMDDTLHGESVMVYTDCQPEMP